MIRSSKFEVLSPGEVSTIYEKSLEFLSNKGIKVDHSGMLKLLVKEGAQVDLNTRQVRFSKDMIEAALKTVPQNWRLSHRGERPDAVFPHPRGSFYVRNAPGSTNYVDPETNAYRNMTVAYVGKCAQLMELLDNIDICTFPSPTDVPQETADIHALKAFLENTNKHVNIQPYNVGSIEYLLELGAAVAGSKEALRKKPVISMTPNAFSPLAIKEVDAEVIVQSTRYGIPIQVATLPCAGATSPASIAGTVLQTCIELLAMATVVQLLNPGNPTFALPGIFTMEMSTGRSLQASAESVLGKVAAGQVFKNAYHIPVNLHGFATDSAVPDGQSMLQSAILGMSISTAGADIISGAGMVEAYMGISPIKMVIDNVLIGILRRLNEGVKVDDDTMAWNEILETVPGSGHYLERAYTLKHCRDFTTPELFFRGPAAAWRAEGAKDLYRRALEKYRELDKRMKPLQLPDNVQKEMNRIVKHADERLAK